MSTLALLLMTTCPVAAGPAQPAQPWSVFSRDAGEQPAPEQNGGNRHSFFGRFRSWFHRSPHGDDNQGQQSQGDWGKAQGYPQNPAGFAPPARFPAGTMPAPVRMPTTAEPPLAAPAPPGK